ncbi:alkaline phosphatase family protein [Nocardia sp. CDC159]|uniref:Alkaline phosphatase family protein n=1 Tax=Nocardia pulmonis TaxID=2951408 RepID=A0A9X2EA62_9NOCA|nr:MULTISPECIES: alkaline phosphatase family protein [Nocardia]MCM6776599.1 alkaline phosphatase family protein [Nocardia pulmonis]MCM6789023.1 alkaline phosphatase family protein [Nocardia sp. CDC159]
MAITRRTCSAMLATGLLAFVVDAHLPRARATEPGSNKVAVIGIDGCLHSELLAAATPNLQRLAAQGTLSRYSIAPHTTVSCPSWSAVLTGVWDTRTGICDNDATCSPEHLSRYPTVFNRIKRAAPQRKTASIATWDTIGRIAGTGEPHADVIVTAGSNPYGTYGCEADIDIGTAHATVAAIAEGTDFVFTHFDQVDIAGHRLRASNPQAYRDAISRVDILVGRIVAAIEQRTRAHPDERWTILVTTDHGHKPEGGHGGQSAYEVASFVIARGPDFAVGRTYNGYSLIDITPTVLDLLGLPTVPDLDGKSLRAGGSGDPAAVPPHTPVVGRPLNPATTRLAALPFPYDAGCRVNVGPQGD